MGARDLGLFRLEHAPDLPVVSLLDAAGAPAGVLLGFPIDLAACLPVGSDSHADGWRAPLRLGPDSKADPDAFAHAVLQALGGRFVFVLGAAGEALRLYPDCAAQVTAVFDAAARTAGSTAHALMGEAEYQERFDAALYERFGVDGEGWFPAGLTAHRGLARLLPGHYLDLASFETRRHAPHLPLPQADPDAIVDEIIAIVQAQLEALARAPKRLAMALTAGRETRVLLACARDRLEAVDFVTVTGGDRHGTDSVIARRIAADLGLSHIELPRREASATERARFIRRGGHCNADSNSRFHPSVQPIAGTHNFAGGVGGENARAFLWRETDTEATEITPRLLTGRLGLPETPALTEALARWLDEAPATDALRLLDLVYNEHRVGAWACAQFACDPPLVRFAPLLTQRTADLMLALPPEWKRQSRLGHEIIARLWPELDRYPYNTRGRLPDLLARLRRAAADPRVVLKKLRKMRH